MHKSYGYPLCSLQIQVQITLLFIKIKNKLTLVESYCSMVTIYTYIHTNIIQNSYSSYNLALCITHGALALWTFP